jgi:hypothetical protein
MSKYNVVIKFPESKMFPDAEFNCEIEADSEFKALLVAEVAKIQGDLWGVGQIGEIKKIK